MTLALAGKTALLARYNALLARITLATATQVTDVWDRLGSYDSGDVAVFGRQVAPIVESGKISAVRAALAYHAVLISVAPVSVRPKDVLVTFDPRTAFTVHWAGLAAGRPWEETVAAGRSSSEAVTGTFIMSTTRQTAGIAAAKSNLRVTGWERIVGPGSCAWCHTVAGQIYISAESADFGHDRCNCTVSPLLDDAAPS